ncbi:synthetic lethal mutants of dpb11-1 five [Ancylostoma caninum]|nr:synthetic lethal mutants of dpb11-1 five [Ancylostoma caninum]
MALPESLMSINSTSSGVDTASTFVDEEEITPDEVLRQMRVAWQNEMAAPCLLPHRYDIIECLVDQVEGMEENLAGRTDKASIRISAHRLELHRLTYITNDYMRRRLQKVEKNPRRALREHQERLSEGRPALLSDQEKRFAERYAKAEAQLMGKTCLGKEFTFQYHGRLQPSFQKIPVPVVDLECERVYAEVVEDNAESAIVPDYQDKTAEVVVELEKGTVHLLPYLSVQRQVEQGSVRLL